MSTSPVRRWRKKPVVIEAERVCDLLRAARYCWDDLPAWASDAYEAGKLIFLAEAVEIRTLEGTMRGEPSDWLIRGVKGELYPCKPEIFYETYEPADDGTVAKQ